MAKRWKLSLYVFKYLGLLLSSDLSRTKHIEGIYTKTKNILGLLYLWFYQYANQETLLQLYVSIVRPNLEYTAPVRDPHMWKWSGSTGKHSEVCMQNDNDKGYNELRYVTNLSPLLQTEGLL